MTTEPRPFEDLGPSGLLWLINTSVLHPRGYALAIHFDEERHATGWSIVGDGTERIWFAEEGWPEGRTPDYSFRAVKELLP